MNARTLPLADVAADLGISEWSLEEMVRDGRVRHLRVGKPPKPGQPDRRPIRFTSEQAAEVLAVMEVDSKVETTVPRRRKRRATA